MSFLETAQKRSSVRRFDTRPVEREKINSCLEAARLAPSAHNSQPWRYLIVDDPALKKKLCDAAFSGIFSMNKFAAEAPVVIVVLAKPDPIANRLGEFVVGTQYYLMDIGASVEHLLLEASDIGLGACWLGWYKAPGVKKALNIPKSEKVVSMIALGYPKGEEKRGKDRKSLEEISSFNSYKP